MTLLKTVKQEDQDHTLFCSCHTDNAVDELFWIAGTHGAEPIQVCWPTYLAEMGSAS
jgi:hypothetical protein